MIHRAVLAGLLLAAQGALACGYCVEDKVAMVYDHSVIVRALNKRHEVAFLAIEGPLAASPRRQRELERAIESTPGVDRASARVSSPERRSPSPTIRRARRSVRSCVPSTRISGPRESERRCCGS
jgi:hypothetical protein